MKEFLPQAIEALAPLLMALLTLLAAVAAQWVRAHVKNVYLRGALLRLDDAVLAVVREVHQTSVAELREKARDGKITKTEAEHLKDKALGTLKDYLGAKGTAELERVFDREALEKVLSAKIEATVLDLKSRIGVRVLMPPDEEEEEDEG